MEIEAESAPVRHGEVHHALVLEHVPSQWKLRTLPETYDLRYICEKGTYVSQSVDVLVYRKYSESDLLCRF